MRRQMILDKMQIKGGVFHTSPSTGICHTELSVKNKEIKWGIKNLPDPTRFIQVGGSGETSTNKETVVRMLIRKESEPDYFFLFLLISAN